MQVCEISPVSPPPVPQNHQSHKLVGGNAGKRIVNSRVCGGPSMTENVLDLRY